VPRRAYLAKVEALRPYVPQHATSLAAPATKFALHAPGATTGITSMHIEEYARMNIAAVDEQPLPEDVVHRLLTSHRFAISLSNAAHWPIAAADAIA
jgi:aryl-alcohol dehydrogenase-like predicted oxidoreductase